MPTQFNADAARKLTEASRSFDGSYLRDETQQVLNQIHDMASSGETKLDIAGRLHYIIINRLENLGFDVDVCTESGILTEITW